MPDTQLANGFSQVSLQELHAMDLTRYPAFVEYMTISKDIDEFVRQVNEIVNSQEIKLACGASVHSQRSVLDALDMSMMRCMGVVKKSQSNPDMNGRHIS